MANTDWPALHGRHFQNVRVLVTGGAGFIGSHLVDALVQLGATVTVLDDLCGGTRDNLAAVMDRITFVQGSILDESSVSHCMEGCRYVFHQAALGSVPRSVAEPRLFVQVNITGTLNLLEAARAAGVQRVLFAASSSAYGDTPILPKVETMPPRPCSPYAASKLAGEHLLMAYSASYGLETGSLRYFNIFGPRQNANSAYAAVIAAFARALTVREQPLIYGDGEQSRDFAYVDNAVHANLLAARCNQPLEGAVMNIACGQRITVNELARQMAEALGAAEIEPRYEPQRAGDVKHSLADLSLAHRLIGYEPIVDFGEGLARTVAAWRSAPLRVAAKRV